MTLLSCRNISKSFGEQTVLQNVNLDIAKKDHIGLVGLNGAGKTTLANILFGQLSPDGGEIIPHMQGLRIGYLLQSSLYLVRTLDQPDQHEEKDEKRFLEVSSYLGLNKVRDWTPERAKGLSGGEKTKLAIAQVWAASPDLLILDEPTNHLDFQGIEWLVQELRSHDITTIIISHDRYFLDQTVTRIVELEDGTLTNFTGNYTAYREEKQQRLESQKHLYAEQTKYQNKINAEIARLKDWSSKAHREAGKVGKMAEMRTGVKEFYRAKAKKMDKQIKSRIKRLEKIEIEGVRRPKEEPTVEFDWSTPEKRGKRLVIADRIAKRFGSRSLFKDSSFYIQRGEKVGLIGPNGSGKTTLINMIGGLEPTDEGTLWVSPQSYFSVLTQEVSNQDSKMTVTDAVHQSFHLREEAKKALNLLVSMGFEEQLFQRRLSELSPGEKTRFRLAMLVMQQQDMLALDEPTNHLDLIYREQLEDTLSAYTGTLLVVSHDRYFLEKICDKLLVIEGGRIRRLEYGFRAYMEKSLKRAEEPLPDGKQRLEDQLMLENRLAFLIGEICKYQPGDERYQRLDAEYKQVLEQKRALVKEGIPLD